MSGTPAKAHTQDGEDLFGDGAPESAPPVTDAPVRRLIVEADGGSRGNPGPAAYGALVMDADTGEVLDSEARFLGVVSNNVAEYSGLIAGLEMARAVAAGAPASLEVRMDSKLVVEQMAGRWKIKHPDMRELARHARGLVPANVVWTWIPRNQNAAADALANQAMDGKPQPSTLLGERH